MTGDGRRGAPDLRKTLRRPGDALPDASIGTVPILWNNIDVEELRYGTDAATILDEIRRVGYEGTQLGLGFPAGATLRSMLADRGLRLAEVYAALPCTVDGPAEDALALGRERLRLLREGGGEVLCVALDGSPDRDATAGRASDPSTPVLTDAGWDRLAHVLRTLAAETVAGGHRFAFHPHTGTYVETPAEVERLVAVTDAAVVGLCLDVGHYLVGGGDPVAALDRYGTRVVHVHLKDVDPHVLARLRAGEVPGFAAAVRERLFTELGAGALDLAGVLRSLAMRRYNGWLMVEQDSSWGPPAEAAAIGRRVLAATLRMIAAGDPAVAKGLDNGPLTRH
jgi:inosose dehydratase